VRVVVMTFAAGARRARSEMSASASMSGRETFTTAAAISGPLLAQHAPQLVRPVGAEHAIAVGLEGLARDLADRPSSTMTSRRPPPAAETTGKLPVVGPSDTGNWTRNSVPWPTTLSTSMEPPCRFTMERTVARPIPVPVALVV
jgi:hypothetical protein